MDSEAGFLAALHDDSADEASWLALADWLEENNRSEQAELLRLHRSVRLASDDPAQTTAIERIRELLLAGVKPCVPTITNSVGVELALIPAGEFLMGSPDDEIGHDDCEGPLHEVEITRPFYLGVFPGTQAQYEAIMKENPSDYCATGERASDVKKLDTSNFPVENVSWNAAVEFCKKLSDRGAEKKAGRVYRLPTEAEWEYACRAWLGNDPFYLGKTLSSKLANYRGTSPYKGSKRGPNRDRPTAVGLYPPNPFGLYDMHGNVWEWCSDYYLDHYYQYSPRQDPTGPRRRVSQRVQRGGCWGAIGECCRSASRTSDDPNDSQYCFGFRVAVSWGKARE
jgi:uncharacterized protein (TIGR02996 family)